MRTIFGKQVYENILEAVQPPSTALFVVDMQNDFVHPDGHHATRGLDTSAAAEIIPALEELVDEARSVGVRVIWIMNTALPGGQSDSPAWLAFRARNRNAWEYTIDGTWGQEIVAPLKPIGDEAIVKKFRSSAFVNTSLDLILRSAGIQTAIITGCFTEGCVASTALSASAQDYYTYLVGNCMASTDLTMHQAALRVLEGRYPVHTSNEYLEAWRGYRGLDS